MVDIPRGWEITRTVAREYHHNGCSYNTQAMLCDCDVLYCHTEQLDSSKLYGAGGRVLQDCPSPPVTHARKGGE
jgi:hypothetical protein